MFGEYFCSNPLLSNVHCLSLLIILKEKQIPRHSRLFQHSRPLLITVLISPHPDHSLERRVMLLVFLSFLQSFTVVCLRSSGLEPVAHSPRNIQRNFIFIFVGTQLCNRKIESHLKTVPSCVLKMKF